MKILSLLWLFTAYLGDLAYVGVVFGWISGFLGFVLASFIAITYSQSKAHWIIFGLASLIVFEGIINSVMGEVGGYFSIPLQSVYFVLVAALVFRQKAYFGERSLRQLILVIFFIEVLLVVLIRLLGLSFFDYSAEDGPSKTYRGVNLMTGLHNGGLNLYCVYTLALLFLCQQLSSNMFRFLCVLGIGYLTAHLGSRAAMVGFVITVGLFLFKNSRFLSLSAFVALLCLPGFIWVLSFVGDIEARYPILSSSGRLSAWLWGYEQFTSSLRYMVLGSSSLLQVYDNGFKVHGMHNIYLELFYRFGLLLYPVIAYFLIKRFRSIEENYLRIAVISVMSLMLFNGSIYYLSSFHLAVLVALLSFGAPKSSALLNNRNLEHEQGLGLPRSTL